MTALLLSALQVLAIPFALLGGAWWLLGLWGRRKPLARPVPEKLEGGSVRVEMPECKGIQPPYGIAESPAFSDAIEWKATEGDIPVTPPMGRACTRHGDPIRYATLDELLGECREDGGADGV